jgi:3-oxoacyl-(acyl-carrier-protein) synthase
MGGHVNNPVIRAVSFMDCTGYGNSRTGVRPWPAPVAEALRRGELEALRWSTLFDSETSRFGRMDVLSRLGLMAVELLEAEFAAMDSAQRDGVGVCVETRSGCLATDWRFLSLPLASTFAYTLPSTVLGEVCIRHRFRGPVMCVLPGPGQGGALETAFGWLNRGEADACVCVACDYVDNKIAAPWHSLDDIPAGGWQGCAAWIGRDAGGSREHPWHLDSLPRLARAICSGATRRPTAAPE